MKCTVGGTVQTPVAQANGVTVLVIVGGVWSTTQLNLAPFGSTLPQIARDVAFTVKVCVPAAGTVKLSGLVQGANEPPSRLQRKAPPVGVEVNSNVAIVELVTESGCTVICVVGAGPASPGGHESAAPPPSPLSMQNFPFASMTQE